MSAEEGELSDGELPSEDGPVRALVLHALEPVSVPVSRAAFASAHSARFRLVVDLMGTRKV